MEPKCLHGKFSFRNRIYASRRRSGLVKHGLVCLFFATSTKWLSTGKPNVTLPISAYRSAITSPSPTLSVYQVQESETRYCYHISSRCSWLGASCETPNMTEEKSHSYTLLATHMGCIRPKFEAVSPDILGSEHVSIGQKNFLAQKHLI